MKGIFNGFFWLVFCLILVGSVVGIPLLALLCYLIFAGADQRQAKAELSLRSTLMSGEQMLAEGIQRRIFALWNRRILVAITNSRIIFVKRGLLGGFKMEDIQWKDLRDATIEQNVLPGICGSNIAFQYSGSASGVMAIDGVESEVAAEIYAKAQAEEQAWEEKRRVRSMEEVRAAAGGVVVHTGPQQSGPSSPRPSQANRMFDEIEKAKQLLDSGVISDAEFQEMKSKILSAN